jgi:hypothetical protein
MTSAFAAHAAHAGRQNNQTTASGAARRAGSPTEFAMLKNATLDTTRLTERAREYAFPEVSPALAEANQRLAPVAGQRWPFEPEALLAAARAKTDLDDFGDATFRTALEVLCRSAEHDLDLNPVGRRNLHGQILDHLCQRLRFIDLWKRKPEILEETIDRPLFIVGLPRSGTTFLQQLLAQDEIFRVTPFWEELSPLPDHDPAIRPPDDKPLIERGEKNVEGLRQHAPGLLAMHQLAADQPEEEIYLLAPGFSSMVYEWVYLLPRYAEWYSQQDHTEGYRFFKRVLQTLQWMRGGKRWLLKAPQHMEQLKPLLTVFPDGTFIETLRDPVTAAISNASLTGYGQRIRTDRPNPHAAGHCSAAIVERLVTSLLRDHPEDDPRFVLAPFDKLMADPIATVRDVYRAAGMTLSEEVLQKMESFIAANRAGRHGTNVYTAEDFDIDVPALRARIAGYYERFGISPDPRFK